MSSEVVLVRRLAHGRNLPLPCYATSGAAGADLHAAVEEPLTLEPGERVAVPTGFEMAVPVGFEMQIRPRSGMALTAGVTVANAPGTVDSDYRGEVRVLLVNLSASPYLIRRGDRIAQAVVAPVARAAFSETSVLPVSQRGSGGFGSTGA